MASQILRVFPRQTSLTPGDEMAFVGYPPLWCPEADEVHISVAFTWDIDKAKMLARAWGQYYPVVRLGGPALASRANGFEAGLYVKPGVTFTSRGCNHHCRWCRVPTVEGQLRLLDPVQPGYIIQDNNFLQCGQHHRQKVYRMLQEQSKAAIFSGGLDARLVTDEVAAELREVRIDQVFLAADTAGSLRPLEASVGRLQFLPRKKLRCYVLIAFGGETMEEARRRLEAVWDIGCLPFAQLYQPGGEKRITYPDEWRILARKWNRPAIMKAGRGKP